MKQRISFLAIFFILVIISTATGAQKKEAAMLSNIHWLGHDTFKITGERVIYTDPFRIKSNDMADIILITHEHFDHCSPEDVLKIQGPDTVIVTTDDCARKLSGIISSKLIKVKPGDKISVKGAGVEAVPAYNTNKQFHTKDRGWVGYIFTINSNRIYLAGDTDHIPEMKAFKDIDIALLPVSGTYVMTADEAVRAALAIKPKMAIPMHYGAIVGSINDAERFRDELKGKMDVTILTPE